MNSHRRKLSAYQLPRKNYQEDIFSASALLTQANIQEDSQREEDDISQLLVKELTFHSIPQHKRIRSYGLSTDIELAIEEINRSKIKEKSDLQTKKISMKRNILEILSYQKSGQRADLTNNSHDSNEASKKTVTDNRLRVKRILEQFIKPPNCEHLVGMLSVLPHNLYAILVSNFEFRGIYSKHGRKFAKLFGEKESPKTVPEDMICAKYKQRDFSLEELPKNCTEFPDIISLYD